MVKNKYFIIFCCLFMFFCSCAQEPEVLYKNGVKTVEESRQITSSFSNAEFPQHVVFSCVSEDENNTLAMDADLVLSEQEIFSGTVEGIKAEKSKIKDVFFEDGEINETYIDSEKVYFLKKNENSKEEIFKDKTLSVDEMGMFQRYYYNNPQLDYYNSLNAEFIEYKDLSVVEKEEIDKIVDTVITSMKSFNPTMVVDHVDIGKTFNGFSLNIQFVDEILGLKCVDISSSFSLYDSGWAICSKEGIN